MEMCPLERSCSCPAAGDVQDQVGWSMGQAGLVKGAGRVELGVLWGLFQARPFCGSMILNTVGWKSWWNSRWSRLVVWRAEVGPQHKWGWVLRYKLRCRLHRLGEKLLWFCQRNSFGEKWWGLPCRGRSRTRPCFVPSASAGPGRHQMQRWCKSSAGAAGKGEGQQLSMGWLVRAVSHSCSQWGGVTEAQQEWEILDRSELGACWAEMRQ